MTMIKPGHTSLNMSDISEDLQVEFHHVLKLNPEFREGKSMDKPVDIKYRPNMIKADDVDLVAGVNANNIAIAASPSDRSTVLNSKMLNGHTEDYFMTAKGGSSVINKTDKIIEEFGYDITDLRNEVYEIKHALEKQGLITNTYQRMGYNDIFRNGYKPYEYEEIGRPIADCRDYMTIYLSSSDTEKLDEHDYIAIYFIDTKSVDIIQIASIGADKETINLDESMDTSQNISADNLIIYKTMGISRDGNFYFAKDADVIPSDISMYTGFDDDTAASSLLLIDKEGLGYSNTFRIPEKKHGFLCDFSVMAEVIGNPTLSCIIIDADDMKYYRNPTQAKTLYESGDTDAEGETKIHFFAQSKPVTLSAAAQQKVSFDFFNTEKDSYPLIDRKDNPAKGQIVRYCVMIYAQYADANNSVKLYAIYNKTPDSQGSKPIDIQTRNILNKYLERPEKDTHTAFYSQDEIAALLPTVSAQAKLRAELNVQPYDESLSVYDMYYEVTLKEPIRNQMIPYKRGLYTAKMKCSYPEGISRVRLMMRFAREGGLWNVNITSPDTYGPVTSRGNIPCKCTSDLKVTKTEFIGAYNDIRKPIELRDPLVLSDLTMKPQLVIGNNLTSGNNTGVTVTMNDLIMAFPNDMVYRNAYIVSVKGKKYKFDPKTQKYKVTDYKKIYLTPIAVIRDGVKDKKDKYSDRIIWEGDFRDENGNAVFFNELEMQIYWEQSNFSESEEVKQEQMGIIHDLVFSTDRAI